MKQKERNSTRGETAQKGSTGKGSSPACRRNSPKGNHHRENHRGKGRHGEGGASAVHRGNRYSRAPGKAPGGRPNRPAVHPQLPYPTADLAPRGPGISRGPPRGPPAALTLRQLGRGAAPPGHTSTTAAQSVTSTHEIPHTRLARLPREHPIGQRGHGQEFPLRTRRTIRSTDSRGHSEVEHDHRKTSAIRRRPLRGDPARRTKLLTRERRIQFSGERVTQVTRSRSTRREQQVGSIALRSALLTLYPRGDHQDPAGETDFEGRGLSTHSGSAAQISVSEFFSPSSSTESDASGEYGQ